MIDWNDIDTVLLDMDGTLLDLHYDNRFWLQHLPRHYARHHEVAPAEAEARLQALFDQSRHQLHHYCTDWWSDVTGMDLQPLKRELAHLIRFRPNAERFLDAVRASGRRALIVTNAHRDVLDLKHESTGIIDLVDEVESAHDHGLPKEAEAFWALIERRHELDPARTLLVDDNLRALEAAAGFGIRHLLAIRQPDSLGPAQDTTPFRAIDDFEDLLPVASDAS